MRTVQVHETESAGYTHQTQVCLGTWLTVHHQLFLSEKLRMLSTLHLGWLGLWHHLQSLRAPQRAVQQTSTCPALAGGLVMPDSAQSRAGTPCVALQWSCSCFIVVCCHAGALGETWRTQCPVTLPPLRFSFKSLSPTRRETLPDPGTNVSTTHVWTVDSNIFANESIAKRCLWRIKTWEKAAGITWGMRG